MFAFSKDKDHSKDINTCNFKYLKKILKEFLKENNIPEVKEEYEEEKE